MYKFLAMRVHNGFLTWEEIKEKSFYEKVKVAYKELYPGEDIGDI